MKIKMPLIFASVLLALSAPAFADDDQKIIAQAAKNIMTTDRKSTRLNSSHSGESRMPSSA